MTLQELFTAIAKLDPDDREQLRFFLDTLDAPSFPAEASKPLILDLHRGAILTTPDFDEPLPDSFWLDS